MPQATGNTTWLTNTRRENTQTTKSVGIDLSVVRLENEAEEKRMLKELSEIHLQAHRTLADRTFELNEAKNDVYKSHKLKPALNEKYIDALLDQRIGRASRIYSEPAGPGGNKAANTSTTSISINRPKTSPARTGFSKIELDESHDDDFYYNLQLKNAATSSTTVFEPLTLGHPSRHRRRPKTSQPARSRRQIRQALEDEFSRAKRRPKTSMGLTTGEHSNTFGRSFIQPHEKTHIDNLHNAEISEKTAYMREIRKHRLLREQRLIQAKLDQFYDRLDQFKDDSDNHVLTTNVLY